MKHIFFQVITLLNILLFPTLLSASHDASTEAQSDFQLTSRSELLEEITELPISDETTQRIYLVRHGESTANVYQEIDGKKVRFVSGQSLNIPLTENGKNQILRLANKLVERFPEQAEIIITSSSALRTTQTATILFQKLSETHPNVTLVQEVYPGLNERGLGEWEGKLRDDSYIKAESAWKALSASEKFVTPEVIGAETHLEVANRSLSALAEIYKRYSGATVIAVTSINTINDSIIKLNNLQSLLSTLPGTNLPKLPLGNGDLILLETIRNEGFNNTHVTSHLKHEKAD